MKNDNNNEKEFMIYSALGGGLIACFMPVYIPMLLCWGGLLGSLYGIANVISKSNNSNNFNFISKEEIKYFENKK